MLQEHRITRAYVVPPIVLALAKHPLVDEFDLSSVEYVLSGAAPLSADLEMACADALGCRMQQGYGMTEASPVTHVVGDDAAGRRPARSGGRCRTPSAGSSSSGPTRTCRPGEPGELWIRGPQVMKGYLNQPEATRAHDQRRGLAPHRRHRPRRRGRRLLDRRPRQGADQVQGLPDRARRARGAAAHPSRDRGRGGHPGPDDEAGEVPKAFVVGSGRPTRSRRSWRERVAPYKKLRAVEVIDEIPKSPSGKSSAACYRRERAPRRPGPRRRVIRRSRATRR